MDDRERCLYIALVGGQPAPILLGLLHLAHTAGFPRPTEILLVGTNAVRVQMERLRRVLSTVAERALNGRLVSFQSDRVVVDPYAAEETRTVIAEALAAFSGGSVVLNLTGGTAMMSLGAYLAAREHAAGSPITLRAQYVVTGDHTFRYNDPGTQMWVVHPFPHPLHGLSLPTLCEAYGVEIVPTPDAHPQWNTLACIMADGGRFMDTAREIKRLNFEYRRQRFCDETGKEQRSGLEFTRSVEPYTPADRDVQSFCERLVQAGLLQQVRRGYIVPRTTDGAIGDFWRGQWLERAVYGCLEPFQRRGWLASAKDEGLLLNARIRPEGDEIDVLAMFMGHLLLVECKDWWLYDEYRSADLKRAIDRLGELRRRLGGTYARAYLIVTRLNIAGRRELTIRREIEARCHNLNVALIELARLPAALQRLSESEPALVAKLPASAPPLMRWFAAEMLWLSERADMP